jgi:hypothetical protein
MLCLHVYFLFAALWNTFLLTDYCTCINWAASWQNQHNGFATSMDPDQPVHTRSLIRIHAVRLQTILQVDNLIANSMDPDQTARIHTGRKPIMLVLSWRGSIYDYLCMHVLCLLYIISYWTEELKRSDFYTDPLAECSTGIKSD